MLENKQQAEFTN